MNTNNSLFFYKGTPFPRILKGPNMDVKMMKDANEMIVLGLQNNVSIEQQKKDYLNQLNTMEQALCNTSNNKIMDENTINKAMVICGLKSLDQFNSIWCLNICALLKLKVIEDDYNNGIMSWE